MMKVSSRVRKFLGILTSAALILVVLLIVYTGSIPEKYRLMPGDASPYDITAPRSIRNKTVTNLRAAEASAGVADVMLRSEQIATEVKTKVEQFYTIVDADRANPPMITPAAAPTPEASQTAGTETGQTTQASEAASVVDTAKLAEQIMLHLNQNMEIVISQDDAMSYATMEDSRYNSVSGHVRSIASLVMADTVDSAALKTVLAEKMAELNNSLAFFKEDSGLIERTLGFLLEPNVVFDQVATDSARQAAYDKVQNNPVMIDKGTRIVSLGDIITDDTYTLLQDLSLIDSGNFDYTHLAGIALLMVLLLIITIFYISHYEKETINTYSDRIALVMIMLIPLLVSAYITRQAPLAPPVYFAAVLIAAYFGFRAAVILSLCLSALILPMTNFNPMFLAVAMIGSLVAALFARGIIRKDNYAFIILATAGANILTALSYSLLQKDSWSDITINCAYTAISGSLSVIAAIGIMPLFEMMFNAVSPLRLIELSQPGHPLLRRLFVEAPGSSQHSMMVANLADSAAAAIGANALLARVGAYYHDIGKLENPLMFTENQEGENPHDYLSPTQSAEIILGHPDAGVRIGRRYRLPPAILRMIHEHHGSTSQYYFYRKAQKLAETGDLAEPDPTQFKYRCPIPSSRESAIVMLADSVEAAMKSTGTNNLDDAERLIRRIIKSKNEQDQLVNSGLSFRDVEILIQAFLQVYTGHFHERVKYPDDRPIRQSAE
ncbi:MAG: HDIG domain-containing protein [Clostridiaceae bacterium]|nr:HDIG domain-containing protein [Clostridiaceae bacterium]